MVYGQYALTNPQSINNGWLTYNRGRLQETGTGSIYTTQQVWAAYPTKASYTNTVTLRYNPTLYANNSGVTINTLSINFGNGYQTLAVNDSASYTYTDSTGLKVIKIKALLSNAQVVETQMVVQVKVTASNTANRYTLANLDVPDFTVPAQAGVHAGCRVYVRRSLITPANQILKPFIVLEGLDANSALPGLQENNSVNDLILEWDELAFAGFDFSANLDDVANYDLVFVDWGNGVGDIPGNAVAFEAVLDWVNQQKTASGSVEQNVVMGISMGGLIARYGLADMVKRSPRKATGTRLLITMDSPHQGAYVPLAFQHIAMALPDVTGPMNIRLGSVMNNTLDRVRDNLLLSPAAQQQLVLRAQIGTANVLPNFFLQNTYRPMVTFAGAVQPEYQFVAVSNGSQCGIPASAPGSSLIAAAATANASGAVIGLQVLLSLTTVGLPIAFLTKLKYQIDFNARGTTGSPNHEILYYKMRRESKLFLLINNNRTLVEFRRNDPPMNNTAWESLPGGTIPITGPNNQNGIQEAATWSLLSPWFLGYNYTASVAPSFTFVPAYSALDVLPTPTTNRQYIFPVQGQNGSTSNNYIAQDFSNAQGTFNITHTRFTARNSRWIFDVMENNQPTFDCTFDCPVVYNTTLTGPDLLCTSGTYSINNLNNLQIAVLSVSPSGIANLVNNNNNTFTITTIANASGFVTITLAVRIPGCNAAAPITKRIYVGKPQAVNIIEEFNETAEDCSIVKKIRYVTDNVSTSYNWMSACELPTISPLVNKGGGNNRSIAQINPCSGDDEGRFNTRVDATNNCGTTVGTLVKTINFNYIIETDPNCTNPNTINSNNYFVTCNPNPVVNNAMVGLKFLPPPNFTGTNPSIYMSKIMLFSNTNQLLTSVVLANVVQYNLNTAFLTPGFYRLLVRNATGEWLEKTIVK